MPYTITRKNEYVPLLWAGGSTTELFIHPRGATNGARDFDIRVSTATVEQEESVFSDFSGFLRHIAPLTGTMRLEHEGHHSVFLRPYETDSFSGGWVTRSFGTCVDFNLIHRPGWNGSIRKIAEATGFAPRGVGYAGIYALRDNVAAILSLGSGTVEETTVEEILGAGDFLCLECAGDARDSCRVECPAERGECFAIAALAFR